MNPGGTSSECPVCGGNVKHPAWKISRCSTCDHDYDRDRLVKSQSKNELLLSLRGSVEFEDKEKLLREIEKKRWEKRN